MADCVATNSEAEAAWLAALAADPFDRAALRGLGLLFVDQGRLAEAIALLSGAGDDAAVLHALGAALVAAGLTGEAEQRMRIALECEPERVETLVDLAGMLLLSDGQQALDLLRRAWRLDADAQPALLDGLFTIGNAAYADGDMVRAEVLYREVIALQPGSSGGYSNLGNALTGQLRLDDAQAAYRMALQLDPGNDGAGFAYSLCLLLAGQQDEGWRWYERRRGVAGMLSNYDRYPDLPSWQPGVQLDGQRVLVTAEQGAGDILQYARFAPALARLAAGVVLEVPWPLSGVLQGLPGIDRVIGLGEPAPDCALTCPLASLPLALGPAAGALPPYVVAPAERLGRWSAWLERSASRRRIGLVCSGDARHSHDRQRSVPLAAFGSLLAVPDVTFVLVQTEIRESDRAAADAAEDLRWPGAALTDYADTAALLAGLDLLITVDTSVAHLAGAMGMPVWTLLAFCPDYRWGLGRDASAWYPSMRLYRQAVAGDWGDVLRRVRTDLDG